MTEVLIVLVIVLAAALAVLATVHFSYRLKRPSRVPVTGTHRILFPYVAQALSPRALDAALRLANAEEATLVPVFLARVSFDLPLETPLPRQSAICIPLQEAIEHRATAFGVPVDARIERGRTYRHALRETIQTERFDRIVIAAATHGSPGFGPDDVAWLLDNAPGEIVILRPSHEDSLEPPSLRGRGRSRTKASAPRSRAWPSPATMRGRSRRREDVEHRPRPA